MQSEGLNSTADLLCRQHSTNMAELSDADMARVPVLAAFADAIFPAMPERAAACEKAGDKAGARFFGISGGDMKEALHMVGLKICVSLSSCKPLHLNFAEIFCQRCCCCAGTGCVKQQAASS